MDHLHDDKARGLADMGSLDARLRARWAALLGPAPSADSIDFSQIAESAADITVVLRGDGTIHWVSSQIESICGWTRDEAQDANWHTFVHPNDYVAVQSAWARAGNERGRFEHRMRCKVEGYRWFRTFMRELQSPSGQPYIVLGMHDIDDDVRQRENSRWSEIGLRKLFDDIPDPVVVWAPIRDEHGTLVDLRARRTNRAYDEFFGGYSPEGRLASAFAPTALRMLPRIQKLLESGGSMAFMASPDPTKQYHVHLSLTGLGEVATVIRDITNVDPEQQESLPTISDRVQHLARMAHTMRTNLNVVQGWTELLEDAALDADPVLRREAIMNIARNAKRLVETVNLLMDSANGDSATGQLPTVDVESILVDIAEDFRVLHPELRIELNISGDLLTYGEAAAVDTVIRHLVENASRFAERRIDIVASRTLRSVDVAIRDDGPGIDKAVALFQPFTPNHHGDGHGLGLNVVATLVSSLQGVVRGGNRVDRRGAEFVVSLPAVNDDHTESSSR